MHNMKSKTFRFAVIFVLLLSLLLTVFGGTASALPPEGTPGWDRAVEAKDRHVDKLLQTEGVAGVGVGRDAGNNPSIIVFTEIPGVRGIPSSLEGIPVIAA